MRATPSPAQAGGDNKLRAEAVGLEAVLEALYDLYRHRDINSLPARILSTVTKLIACDSALNIRIDPATRSFSLMSWPADAFAAVDHREVSELHLRDHPIVAHFSADRDARAWMLHDFIPRATFQNTMLYRTVYRPLGIEFQLAMLLPSPDRAPRALVLNCRDRQFSEQDRELLALLWPHMNQAFRNARATSRQRGLPPLGGLPPGLVLLC